MGAALTTVVTNRLHRVDAHGPRTGQNLITLTLQICRRKMPTASRSQRTCVSRLLRNLRSILTSSRQANRRSSNSTKKATKSWRSWAAGLSQQRASRFEKEVTFARSWLGQTGEFLFSLAAKGCLMAEGRLLL